MRLPQPESDRHFSSQQWRTKHRTTWRRRVTGSRESKCRQPNRDYCCVAEYCQSTPCCFCFERINDHVFFFFFWPPVVIASEVVKKPPGAVEKETSQRFGAILLVSSHLSFAILPQSVKRIFKTDALLVLVRRCTRKYSVTPYELQFCQQMEARTECHATAKIL